MVRGRVQTIFVKNNVKMMFKGWGIKTCDVSSLLTGRSPFASTWKTSDVMEGGRGGKHDVKMT